MRSPGHPFYERLKRGLGEAVIDAFVQQECARFCSESNGRSSIGGWRSPRPLAAGRYQLATRFPGHAPTTHSLVIEPGRVNTLVVPLDPAAPLR